MRWGLVVRLVLAAAAVAGAALCVAVAWLGASGSSSYQGEEWARSEARYAQASRIMPFEAWKGWFGEGTAILAGGDAAAAEPVLEEALERVPAARECLVRVNLSLAQERQGDAAQDNGDRSKAVEFYNEALETLADCPESDEAADDSRQRLEDKLAEQEADEESPDEPGPDERNPSQEPSPGGTPSPSPSGSQGSGESGTASGSPDATEPGEDGPSVDPGTQRKLDRLDEQNRTGQRERQDTDESRRYRPPRSDIPIW
jgi:tetratricopeptide (TPR) repeat protein